MSNDLTPIGNTAISKFLPANNEEFATDTDYAKRNLYDIIETGQSGLQTLLQIAESSQHPRAFEVLSTYLKNLSEINKDLVDISEKRKDAKKEGDIETNDSQVTNNLFVGSTKELADLIAQQQNKKNDN